MIILAAAIILSLSNSGIIGKANKAKIDSDTANLKEYVNTLRAEWELMSDEEKTGTFVEYANLKLEEKGYKRQLTADGKTLMNEVATATVKAGIKVGDIVTGYNMFLTEDKSSKIMVDGVAGSLTRNKEYIWHYIGIGEDGEILIAADMKETDSTVTLSGANGYLNGPNWLNDICDEVYSVEGKGKSRSMNMDDVNSILEYTSRRGSYYSKLNHQWVSTKDAMTIGNIISQKGEPELTNTKTPNGKNITSYYANYYSISNTSTAINTANKDLVYQQKSYWLASPCVNASFVENCAYFNVHFVNSSYVEASSLFASTGSESNVTHSVRPVVALDSSVSLTKDATSENKWKIN